MHLDALPCMFILLLLRGSGVSLMVLLIATEYDPILNNMRIRL